MKILAATLLLIITLSCSYAQRTAAMFHNCNNNCGVYNGSIESSKPGGIKWKVKTGGKIFSSPALALEHIYIGSEDGYLYAIAAATGKIRWKYKSGGAIHSSPAVVDGHVFFGSFDGYYYALDAKTGKLKWRFKTGGEKWMGGTGYFGMKPSSQYMEDPWDYFLSSPVFDRAEGQLWIYFGSSDHHLYKLNAATGTLIWKYKTNGSIHTTAAIDAEKVYIGSWDASMYAIDKQNGTLIWKFETGLQPAMTGIQSSPIVVEGKVYFGARDAHFYCLNAQTGLLDWKYDAENAWILSTPTIRDSTVYVGTSDSYLMLALNKKTGKELFRFKANGYVFTSPSIYGNTLYFGDFTGNLFAIDLNTTPPLSTVFSTNGRQKFAASILKEDKLDFAHAAKGADLSSYQTNVDVMNKFYSLGPFVSSPVVDERVLYIGSADGFIYAINLE